MAGVFIRAVITGFGFSLGKAIFEEVQKRIEKYKTERSDEVEPDNDDPPPDLGDGQGHAPAEGEIEAAAS